MTPKKSASPMYTENFRVPPPPPGISIYFGRNDTGPSRLTQKIGRNDSPTKADTTYLITLVETTQAKTTQAETTQGRNDPDSVSHMDFIS